MPDDREIVLSEHRAFEVIPAIVYIWSVGPSLEGMREEYVSPQIRDVLGFGAEEWMADPDLWVSRLHPDDRDEVLDETARCVEAGEGFRLEYRMIARDGRVVWLHDVASVLDRDDEGRALRFQGVQLDITARKEAEQQQRQTLDRLRRIDRERRQLLRRLVGAQEEERRRISEGVHDDVMQRLYQVQHSLTLLGEGRPELEHAFADLDADLSEVTVLLRRLAFDLHPRMIGEHGLEAALGALIERSSSAHTDVRFGLHLRLDREPPTEIGLVVYRTAHEALSNVTRHSGASNVTIQLDERPGGVTLTVEDDGQGFTPDPAAPSEAHLGLSSIRERAEALGGALQVESTPGSGTKLVLRLPIENGTDEESDEAGPETDGASDDITEGPSAVDQLSPRELEVAELLALGHTNSEIGSILRLSVRTVEHHRSRVMRKLGVGSRAGVVKALGVAREAQRALRNRAAR